MEYPFKDLLPLDEVLAREGYYKDWTHLDPEVFYSLTQISEYIKTKGYGVDVRLLIAQLAEHFGLKTTQVVDLANLLSTKHDALKDQFDVVIRDATSGADWGGEIVLARGGKANLGQRLDETTSNVNATNLRIDNLVIPLSPENANIEVTDAHNSITKNKNFDSIKDRFESVEEDNISLEKDINPMRNILLNGDFTNVLDEWFTVRGDMVFENGFATFTTTDSTAVNGLFQEKTRKLGHKYYFSAKIKADFPEISFYSNGTPSSFLTGYSGFGDWERKSMLITAPSDSLNWRVGISNYNGAILPISVDDFMIFDLSEHFGIGNEPSQNEMDLFIEYIGGYNDILLHPKKEYAKFKEIQNLQRKIDDTPVLIESTGIQNTKEVTPVLFGVKMSNELDKSSGYASTPKPIGWLYYHPENFKIYYAHGSPDNVKYLCDWKREVTWDGQSSPQQYRPFVTKKGDIIFVWRGDLSEATPRQNPIVYPAGDYNNPVEVSLSGVKPTAWLMNSGVDYVYNRNLFLFSEYTRPWHGNGYVWRVTEPVTNPANWTTTHSIPLSENEATGYKHYHTMNYDPFSGMLYMTTGDYDVAAKIFESGDYGLTWNVVLEGDRSYARVINFVFTKDKVYWANDDNLHYFHEAPRNIDGVPDFSQATRLFDLQGHPPTYVNVFLEDLNGILILNRYDTYNQGQPLTIFFWDIDAGVMRELTDLYAISNAPFGFRVEAINFYQARSDKRIIAGFGYPSNEIDILGNIPTNQINNVAMEIVNNGVDYGIKFTTISAPN